MSNEELDAISIVLAMFLRVKSSTLTFSSKDYLYHLTLALEQIDGATV